MVSRGGNFFICFLAIFVFSFPVNSLSAGLRTEKISQALDRIESQISLAGTISQTPERTALYPACPPPCREKKQKSIYPAQGKFSLSAGYNFTYFDYEEVEDSVLLDQDFGDLHGFFLTLDYDHKQSWGKELGYPFAQAYFRYYQGNSKYDGHATDGFSTWPFTFTEPQEVFRYGIRLGGKTRRDDNSEVFGYIDLGHRLWNRGNKGTGIINDPVIGPVQICGEQYWWTYFGLGGGINYILTHNRTWGFDLTLMLAPDSWSKMHADSGGGATFDLGEVYGLEIKLPFTWKLKPRWTFDLIPYYTYWEINKSDYIDLGGGWVAWEPPSKTVIFGFTAGLTHSF